MQFRRLDAKIWQANSGRLILTLAAGLVFPFAFAPFNLWPLAILSLLLLYQSIQYASRTSQIIGICFVFAIGKYASGAYWVFVSLVSFAEIHLFLAIGLFLSFLFLTAVLFSILAFFTTKSRSSTLNALVFASGLTVVEILFSLPWPLSFPWLHLGYALIDTPLSIFAPYGGVWAISFAGAFTAACISELLNRHSRPMLTAILLWCPGLFLTVNHTIDSESISVALVQGDISLNDKWSEDGWRESLMKYSWLSKMSPSADLVVWPESALPVDSVATVKDIIDELQDLDGRLVFGSLETRREAGRTSTFNVVVALKESELSFFRKEQLVPFGEYIPMRNFLGDFLQPLGYPMSNLRPDEAGQELLQLGGLSLGTAICYEIAYPHLVRQRGFHADLIVVLSEDSWLGDTTGPWQHLQIARMRALELSRPLVRATNDGVTASIDANGSIVKQLPRYREDVLLDTVALQEGRTVFARFGLLPIALLIVSVLLVHTSARRFRLSHAP